MTNEEIYAAVAANPPAGWECYGEPTGAFYLSLDGGPLVYATIDWDGAEGAITVEIDDLDGDYVADAEIPFPVAERTAERYVELVAPQLQRAVDLCKAARS